MKLSNLPGEILAGRYHLLERLGQGGMGTVYLARDQRFQQRFVALKENLNTAPEARTQFRLEAELLLGVGPEFMALIQAKSA